MDLRTRIKSRFGGAETGGAARGNIAPRPVDPIERKPLDLRAATGPEQEWKHRIHQKLLSVIDLSLISSLEDKQARAQIREITQRLMEEEAVPLNMAVRQHLVKQVEDEILGLGPLEPLLADPSVSDILVNGGSCVYVERYGKLELTPLRFQSEAHLMNIIDRIVSGVGRRIDESAPMVDARLKDGSRVNAIVPSARHRRALSVHPPLQRGPAADAGPRHAAGLDADDGRGAGRCR